MTELSIRYHVRKGRLRFCNDGCREAFWSDKEHGVFTPGPHATPHCSYCNAEVPPNGEQDQWWGTEPIEGGILAMRLLNTGWFEWEVINAVGGTPRAGKSPSRRIARLLATGEVGKLRDLPA